MLQCTSITCLSCFIPLSGRFKAQITEKMHTNVECFHYPTFWQTQVDSSGVVCWTLEWTKRLKKSPSENCRYSLCFLKWALIRNEEKAQRSSSVLSLKMFIRVKVITLQVFTTAYTHSSFFYVLEVCLHGSTLINSSYSWRLLTHQHLSPVSSRSVNCLLVESSYWHTGNVTNFLHTGA